MLSHKNPIAKNSWWFVLFSQIGCQFSHSLEKYRDFHYSSLPCMHLAALLIFPLARIGWFLLHKLACNSQ